MPPNAGKPYHDAATYLSKHAFIYLQREGPIPRSALILQMIMFAPMTPKIANEVLEMFIDDGRLEASGSKIGRPGQFNE